MKLQKNNRQTAAWRCHNLTQNNKLAVSSETNLRVYHHQMLNVRCSASELSNRPKTSVICQKFTTVQVYFFRLPKVSQLQKKYGSKITNHSPLALYDLLNYT